MTGFFVHYVCPHDGRKLSKVEAMEHATINVRRSCPHCHRRYSLTITPIAIKQGWAHSACIVELERKITSIEDGA